MKSKKILKEIDKDIRNSAYLFLFLIILHQIFMAGMFFNFIVMTNNGGRMPVELSYNYSDYDHFSYQNKSEISYHYYSDIYLIFGCIYSLGDLLMLAVVFVIIGLLLYRIGNIAISLYINYRDKKT